MSAQTESRPARGRDGVPAAAPIGIVHIGLGSFFRAHGAWYTDRAPDRDRWGIAAFGGRRAGLADTLSDQDGVYTLLTRRAEGPVFETVASVSTCHRGADHGDLLRLLAATATRLVTLTVTEAGYRRAPGGGLDTSDPAVAADLDALRGSLSAPVGTVPARLVAGLAARRDAGAGPCAVLSCDNVDANGEMTARVVLDAARAVDGDLAAWIERRIAFPQSMVDRITPSTTDDDVAEVRAATGVADAAPVVTEPFSEWVLEDRFPGGRPRWEEAGATFVDDVTVHERRKLLMLNGAHSLLAYAGPLRGHETVAEAITDPVVRGWAEAWWDLAGAHVGLPAADLTRYRAELVARFANPAIRHRLAQIAGDGSQKLPVRVLPVLRAERAAGRLPHAAVRTLAAWLVHLREGTPVDPRAGELTGLASGPPVEAAARVVALLDPDLAADGALVTAVAAQLGDLLGNRIG